MDFQGNLNLLGWFLACVLLERFIKFPVDPYYEPLLWFMINSYYLWYRTQLWQSNESSSFFFIKTEWHFSCSGWAIIICGIWRVISFWLSKTSNQWFSGLNRMISWQNYIIFCQNNLNLVTTFTLCTYYHKILKICLLIYQIKNTFREIMSLQSCDKIIAVYKWCVKR